MTIKADEIRELLDVVREILRNHRRMALYEKALYEKVYVAEMGRTYDTLNHDRARDAVLAFDNMFKEPS